MKIAVSFLLVFVSCVWIKVDGFLSRHIQLSQSFSRDVVGEKNIIVASQQENEDQTRKKKNVMVAWERRRVDEEWEDLAEQRAMEKRQRKGGSGDGLGETAAGAVLGGLLLGPFGALWGASVGANFGSSRSYERAKKEELQRMGLNDDILEMARDVAMSLETSERGLNACQDSLRTLQQLATTQESRCQTLHAQAKDLLLNNDEEAARAKLLERTQLQDKLKQTLTKCAQEKKRVDQMRDNVDKLQERAAEIQALVSRTVSAKTNSNINMNTNSLSLSNEDPLLAKFKDAGIID